MITSKFEKQGIFALVHSSSQTFNFPYININKRQVWKGHNFDYVPHEELYRTLTLFAAYWPLVSVPLLSHVR